MKEKTVIGIRERVVIFGRQNKKKEVIARIDTGATKSAIDIKLSSQLRLGPILDAKRIRSSHGTRIRPIIEVKIEMRGEIIKGLFTLSDRNKMKYPVLIGRNMLKKGDFLIDPKLKTITTKTISVIPKNV